MSNVTVENLESPNRTETPGLTELLRGFRFSVCQTPEAAERAIAVRREVYCRNFGYQLPMPDQYDHRSWLLLAEDTATGQAIGTMRLTPRHLGPLEAEEYFTLPRRIATQTALEISRFAILPAYRKTKTPLPVVSLGLFKLCHDFSLSVGSREQVVCSKPERMWTYQSLGFEATGLSTSYVKLNGAEHELLWHDFRRMQGMPENPFHELLCSTSFREIVLPVRPPRFGLAVGEPECFRLAVGA